MPYASISDQREVFASGLGKLLTAADEASQGGDPLGALEAVTMAWEAAGEMIVLEVAQARSEGRTWAQIGAALGVTAQAAHARYRTAVELRLGSYGRPGDVLPTD